MVDIYGAGGILQDMERLDLGVNVGMLRMWVQESDVVMTMGDMGGSRLVCRIRIWRGSVGRGKWD